MKNSGNKGVTLEHTTAKAANIATVFNWNPIKKALTYGTGTAIGKHTILTANHVVNNPEAHKPMSPSSLQNLRVNLLQEGSRSEEHTSELQSRFDLVCRLLLEKK